MINNSIERSILRGTIIIVLVGILGKLASFITETVLAAYLGTTYQSDAYYMVWGVHAVIYPMLSIGIWQVFLPLYKSHIAKNETEAAYSLTNKTITFFTTLSLLVTVFLVFFSPIVVSIIAPGFDEETRKLCIKLVRISAPQYVFIIASAIYASILQCHEEFFGSQIREVVSYIPTIFAGIFFYDYFGVEAIAVSLVIASIFRLLVELPFISWDYRFRPDIEFKSKEFIIMLNRLPSALMTSGVTQLNTLIDKAMASTLSIGTISGLNYGHKLMNVFSGFLSSAIATALYPQTIELIALNKQKELGALIEKIINIYSIIMLPVTIACVLFRTEFVAAVFQHGQFDENSTAITAGIFAMYSLGIFFIACNTVINNIFYGYGNTRVPMFISFANLVINVILNIIFIKLWGANGLAFATSLSALLTFVIRMYAVKNYVLIRYFNISITALKVLSASLISCLIPRIIFMYNPMNKYAVIAISAVITAVVYIIIIKLLKIQELEELLVLLKRKIK